MSKQPKDAVQHALKLLAEQKAREREEVVAAIRSSIADMEAVRGTPLSQVDAELRQKEIKGSGVIFHQIDSRPPLICPIP